MSDKKTEEHQNRPKMLDQETKQKIASALEAKGATNPCPRCSNSSFVVLEGYFNHAMTAQTSGGMIFGGPVVPVAVIACDNCGFLSEHALGAIGLLGGGEKE